ncbi:hypothetical protein DRP07_01500 [Archaeoglobales archaeon]|nr:MAG: hypothetical protein DRP07_01500 [Archaeoglobales archaeon]
MYAFMTQNLLTKRNILFVLLLLTALNLADLITTLFSLNAGLYEEINTIIKFLYLQSPVVMAIYKIVIPLIPFLFLLKYRKSIQVEDYSRIGNREKIKTIVISSIFLAMIWSTIFYVFVVLHNLLLIFFGISL